MIGFLYHLTENKIIFEKQFGFRAGHPTDHEFLELTEQICECFVKKVFFRNFP